MLKCYDLAEKQTWIEVSKAFLSLNHENQLMLHSIELVVLTDEWLRWINNINILHILHISYTKVLYYNYCSWHKLIIIIIIIALIT